ncbi:MAG: response regulator transcription factor [Clostridium sp.]
MICVVEDDPNIREIEVYAMKDCHMETKEASCAKEFWKLCENEVPELVLLDIMLPDEDGISIVKKMREDARLSDVPVILVTAKGTEIDKVRGLDAGADDYIAKPFGILEMISRVKAVLRRSKIQEASVEELSAGNIRMNVEKHRVYVDDELIELTYKEFELLRVFLSNAEMLCQEIFDGSCVEQSLRGIPHTDMHIKTLRKKLGEAGERIHTVRNVGIV